jgi:putative hydrolase of the HAD superfamily
MDSEMPRYLIWDFDGTLGYRQGSWSGAMVEVLQRDDPSCGVTRDHLRPHIQTGFPWHEPHVRRPAGRTADDWWKALEPVFVRAFLAVGVPLSRAELFGREVRAHYLDMAAWSLYDDSLPVLEQLSREGWKHLILSNHVPELSEILDRLGLLRMVDRIFNSAETGIEKPHAEAFQNVLHSMEADATVWMVGDSLKADIDGAAAAGIPGILVRSQQESARYQYQCERLEGVMAFIASSRRDG